MSQVSVQFHHIFFSIKKCASKLSLAHFTENVGSREFEFFNQKGWDFQVVVAISARNKYKKKKVKGGECDFGFVFLFRKLE